MAFPSSTNNVRLDTALDQLQNTAASIKSTASAVVAVLAANSVNTAYVFSILDQLSGVIVNLNTYKSMSGLNAYASSNIPGYAGTLTTDITATIAAAQACIDWVVANFPKDSTNTYILAYTLKADGTRTMATFTSVQTAGLRTVLNTLIASIS